MTFNFATISKPKHLYSTVVFITKTKQNNKSFHIEDSKCQRNDRLGGIRAI